jgi:multiple antibiotic resistance protein
VLPPVPAVSGPKFGAQQHDRRKPINIFGEAVVLTVGTLFPIMNPFSTAPLFVSLTAGFGRKRRNRDALMACIYAFGILVMFLLLGTAIIDFFGISVAGIRIAGGLIIAALGFQMLFPVIAPRGPDASASSELEIAFTPLAMPSLAGPGSISVVVTAASQIKSNHPDNYSLVYLGVVIGIALTVVIAWLILRTASSMARLLGPSGIDALTRIFGFLLISIGIQFLLTGVSDFFGLVHGP